MKIEKIYFDLDHTLWDYDTNSRETLGELFDDFGLDQYFLNADSFSSYFYYVNYKYWDLYNKGKIDRDYIRKNRFREVLEGRIEADDEYFLQMSNFFKERCPRKPGLMPGALELLDLLKGNYRLGIITNGFNDVQHIKLTESGLLPYFEIVVTSESASSRKPDVRIFDHALKESRLDKSSVMMIGDNLATDILGAEQAGWRSCWYNPWRKEGEIKEQIAHLRELLDLL